MYNTWSTIYTTRQIFTVKYTPYTKSQNFCICIGCVPTITVWVWVVVFFFVVSPMLGFCFSQTIFTFLRSEWLKRF